MSERKIPGPEYDNETQNKILDTATELFALKGFNAVSMRDIAKTVGIKASSIYNYYDGKDSILDDVLTRFEKGYRHYFDWLTDMNSKAESLEILLENMFNREFVEMRDPIACLGMSLIVKEQHNNKSARDYVLKLFYDFSIKRMQADFDDLIKRNIIPPSDTKTIATLFMLLVIVSNDIRIHEYIGLKPPLDSMEIYNGMKKMIGLAITSSN